MIQNQVLLCIQEEVFSLRFKQMNESTLFVTTNQDLPSKLFMIKNEEVIVLLYDDIHGEMKYTGQIEKIISNTIRIRNLTKHETTQRRYETRVPFKTPIEIKQIQSDKLIELEKPMLIHSANISANGILFASQLDIPMFVQFYIDFPLEKESISFWVKVMRKEKRGKDILYGCSILWDSTSYQDKFRQFVFKEQVTKHYK